MAVPLALRGQGQCCLPLSGATQMLYIRESKVIQTRGQECVLVFSSVRGLVHMHVCVWGGGTSEGALLSQFVSFVTQALRS